MVPSGPPNFKIIKSQWTGSLCVKVMFGLAENQLNPANQHARTKCFCLHLEYLNAAELPHVNHREIEEKRVVRNTERQKNKTSLYVSYFTEKLKKHECLFLWYRKKMCCNMHVHNLNPQIINIENQRTREGKEGVATAECWGVDWQWWRRSSDCQQTEMPFMNYATKSLATWTTLEPEWLHVPGAWGR